MQELPIAECFTAPQGEGVHVGRLMTFVRLAGCTVGTRYPKQYYDGTSPDRVVSDPLFPIYTNECHLYDGRSFPCDTDYRNNLGKHSVEGILKLIIANGNAPTICISGGEPLMHDIFPLVSALKAQDRQVHIETSGTIPITTKIEEILDMIDHVAISPKLGFRDEYSLFSDEIKLLVDEHFEWERVPSEIKQMSRKIYLQPVNYEKNINHANVERCLVLQRTNPDLLLSTQNHKIWETR